MTSILGVISYAISKGCLAKRSQKRTGLDILLNVDYSNWAEIDLYSKSEKNRSL